MNPWIVLLIVFGALLLALAIGGAVATARRTRAYDDELFATVDAVNEALAAARALDKRWEPARLDDAARAALATSHPGVEPTALHLVHVDDRPGTEKDRATFRAALDGAEYEVTLGRDADGWVTVGAPTLRRRRR